MLIIVEGVDGSGKSTLIKQLEDKGVKRVTAVPREWPQLFSHCYDLYNFCSHDKHKYVMDRSVITEWIYRFVKNDKEPTSSFRDLVSLLDMEGLMIVICKNKKSFENSIVRGEDYIRDETEHNNIKYLYDFVAYTLKHMCDNVKVTYYDYDEKFSMNRLLKFLKLE